MVQSGIRLNQEIGVTCSGMIRTQLKSPFSDKGIKKYLNQIQFSEEWVRCRVVHSH